MVRSSQRLRALSAGLALIVGGLPPIRTLLESSMTLHMLVQLPALALSGFAIGTAWREAPQSGLRTSRVRLAMDSFNVGGTTGVLAASFVMVWWMLPMGLDDARLDLSWDAVKFATITIAGAAIALSWPRVPTIARGVIHLEVIATLLRFGWAYLATPERLCASYLEGDQQRTGALLLWAGLIYSICVVWRPVFGSGLLQSVPVRGKSP